MKKLVSVLLVLFSLAFKCQTNFPAYINYQAVVRDLNGEAIPANTNVVITFKLYDSFTASTFSYEEVHNTTTSNFGYVSLQIGKGIPTGTSTINDVNWAGGQVCYEVYLNSASVPIMAKQNFASTPYSFYALKSGTGTSAGNTTITAAGIISATPNAVSSGAYTLDAQAPVFNSSSIGTISLVSYPNYLLNVPAASLAIVGNSVTLSHGTVVSTQTLSTLSGSGTINYVPLFSGSNSFSNSNIYRDPTNKLGINTTTPSSFIHALTSFANDTFLLENPFNGNISIALKSASNYYAMSLNGSDLKIQELGSVVNDRMVFNAGRIGIGTSTPAFPLELTSSSVTPFQINGSNASGSSMFINAVTASTSPKYGYKVAGLEKGSHYLTATGDWKLDVNSVNAISVLAANSNVGISNASPNAKLHVLGNSIFRDTNSPTGFSSIIENNTASGQSGGGLKVVNSNTRNLGNTGLAVENIATTTLPGSGVKVGLDVRSTGPWSPGFGQINVSLLSTVSGADYNYSGIFLGGNVGIGTSSPKTTLSVNGGLAVKVTHMLSSTYTASTTQESIVHVIVPGSIVTLAPSIIQEHGSVMIINNRDATAPGITLNSSSGDLIFKAGIAAGAASIIVPPLSSIRLYNFNNGWWEF